MTAAVCVATGLASLRGQSPSAEPHNIVSVAGVGPYIGDGGAATSAGLSLIEGVAIDVAGNLWIAYTGNNRIRKVDAATGIITTVVGTGAVGFAGDGGPAIQAELNSPSDLGFDTSGHLYLTDAGNHRVRKIDRLTGIITTVGGTGAAEYGGDSGPASAAELNNPRGIALALEATGTSIYIADLRNHVVRKIDGDGIITTVAGTGVGANSPDGGLATETTINNPFGVAVDSAGNLFIGEGGVGNTFSHRVRKVDAITKIVTTVVGTGVAGSSPDGTIATLAQINSPRDVVVDASGNLYFVDNTNHRIRVVNSASGIVSTVAGTGVGGFSGDDGLATAAQLFGPFFIALDVAGHVYIGDRGNSRARKVDRTTGIITTVAGGFVPPLGDGKAATSAYVLAPAGIAFDTSGNLYLADNFTNRVRRVDAATGIITTIAGTGLTGLSADGIPAVTATLNAPQGVVVDSSTNVYIADFSLPRVRKIDGLGSITTVAGTGVVGSTGDGGQATQARLGTFRGIGLDTAGNLWIADTSNHRVRFVNLSAATVHVAGQAVAPGVIVTVVGTGVQGFAGAARITAPIGLAFTASGLFITELNRVRFVNLAGGPVVVHNQLVAPAHITTIAGTAMSGNGGDGGPATAAQLFGPQGLTVDAAGNLYIADTNNDRIRRIDTAGVITTAAGSGLPGFSGDGGSATASALQNPRFVALDAFGNLHLSEFGGNRVRRLNIAARELFVIQSTGDVVAHLEFHEGRLPADLHDVTLSAIDSAGQPMSRAFPNSIVLPEPGNPRKRIFHFSPDAALLTGAGMRLDGRLASDGRRFSGDCAQQGQKKCKSGR